MKSRCLAHCLGDIAQHIDARLVGDSEVQITGVSSLDKATSQDITFLDHERYIPQLEKTQAAAVVLSEKYDSPVCKSARLIVAQPRLSFIRVVELLMPEAATQAGIHPSACVHESCTIGEQVSIGAGACLAEGVQIGDGCEIAPNCVIGAGSQLGRDCRLEANVSLGTGVQLGQRVIIHAGACIGFDGFGLTQDKNHHWVKIPQRGSVVIGDDAEIGCNSTIACGTLEDTVIGEDVRIDNLVHVAHNVRIGAHTAIAGCVGIAGSAEIGQHCLIGGASRIKGHIKIADGANIVAGSFVSKPILKAGYCADFLSHMLLRRQARRLRLEMAQLKSKLKTLTQR